MKISKTDLQKLTTVMENNKLSIDQVIELIKKSKIQAEKDELEIKKAIDCVNRTIQNM